MNQDISPKGKEEMDKNAIIKVFLADDHPLLRAGLRISLGQRNDMELIGEAGDGFSAVEKIRVNPPDVSLIDVDMPGLSGIGVIRILRKSIPEMKILVLSTYNDDNYIKSAMAAGADGYVLKSVGIEELEKIIKSFHAGKPEISPYLVNLTIDNLGGQERDKKLTIREKEVLKAVAEGKCNKEISEMLYISTETVKSHVKNIYKKLKIRNRAEAVSVAAKEGC